ncbi:hypothetical protein Glove_759g15 [Diversispora epigaea]|uniref:F-box domain-containing protein n=1 Tax=Diversispora epigaea TaxID=1348612 RepID=A0A397FZB5_9GLOM|nr:hypothetical protein Glove_759g15 [Diversispora epigaea]
MIYYTLLPTYHHPSSSSSSLSRRTLDSLPDDILYIIGKELDFLSILALRSTCQSIYLSFPDTITFSHVFLPPSVTQSQFIKLFSYLELTEKLSLIRKFTFNESKVTEDAIISVLGYCENLAYIYILGCERVKLLPITNAITSWYEEEDNSNSNYSTSCSSSNSSYCLLENNNIKKKRKMEKLKKIVMTRCVGGKRHSLLIKKILEDLKRMKDHHHHIHHEKINPRTRDTSTNTINTISSITSTMSHMSSIVTNYDNNNYPPTTTTTTTIQLSSSSPSSRRLLRNDNNDSKNDKNSDDDMFEFQSCQHSNCGLCTLSCAQCGMKYKYWDEIWIKCGWCKENQFCGACMTEASKNDNYKNYAFQFGRIKLCQMFNLSCSN